MNNTDVSTVYTLRVDVTVPHVNGKPDYSAAEIVNRVESALFHVPGDCDVQLQEYGIAEIIEREFSK